MAPRPLTAPLVTAKWPAPVFVMKSPVKVAFPALSVVATGSLVQLVPTHWTSSVGVPLLFRSTRWSVVPPTVKVPDGVVLVAFTVVENPLPHGGVAHTVIFVGGCTVKATFTPNKARALNSL